ncbi:hypothetical protein [Pseudactinotalea terrae]|uniref:hypothetical protein n=1 Tax=Pseudactinotalea terrae TaxID=1743262 RepID=UPI0012E262A3|nr:hypothetical protein [Pseudactinotalea terrae]
MTRGRWWAVAGTGVGIVGILALIGSDLPHALLGGLLWLIGVLVVIHLGVGQRVSLPRLPFDRRDGARTEVASLSWALYGNEGVTPQAARQLRHLCRDGLAEAGIDVDTPTGRARAAELLGDPLTAFVVDPDSPPPPVKAVRTAVHALENLEKSL